MTRLALALSVVVVGAFACGSQSSVRCLPSNCSGCCSNDDECVVPNTFQCGVSGSACIACGATQSCISGLCLGGTGGSGGFGGGVGSGGGDGSVGGGDGSVGGGSATTGGGTATSGGGSATTGGGTATTGGGTATTGGGTATVGGGTATVGGGTATVGGGTATVGGGTGTVGGGTATTGGGTGATGGGAGSFVINEIDYDNPSTDTSEFVELFNGTNAPIALGNYSVLLVNGGDGAAYRTIDLADAGTLAAGQFAVIASTATLASVPASAMKIPLSVSSSILQNGPDGVALVVTSSQALVDSISYGGDTLWNGTTSLTEGSGSTASLLDDASDGGSIARVPNGVDTNQSANDWVFTTRTPGTANQ